MGHLHEQCVFMILMLLIATESPAVTVRHPGYITLSDLPTSVPRPVSSPPPMSMSAGTASPDLHIKMQTRPRQSSSTSVSGAMVLWFMQSDANSGQYELLMLMVRRWALSGTINLGSTQLFGIAS